MDAPDEPPRAGCVERMTRFDALPIDARRALDAAAFEFHPQVIEKWLARGVSGANAAKNLSEVDAFRSARERGVK